MFIADDCRKLLELNGLDKFETVWNAEAEWIETPNRDRGGWSGVGRLSLDLPQGGRSVAYLKRQQNHARFSLRHPIKGETTFSREFSIIQRLQAHAVKTLKPMLFGVCQHEGEQRAVLMTEDLAGYQSLDELMKNGAVEALPLRQKRQLLAAVADFVRRMHAAGVEHRSLYAKHLFVKSSYDGYDIAIIDLEKSRVSRISFLRMVTDLISLNYRTGMLSRADRLFFYRHYCGGGKLNVWDKFCLRYIIARSYKKRLKSESNARGHNPERAERQR